MDNKNTHFPQYRKLKNGLRLYKINSSIDFEELQIMGEKIYYFKFVAEQYPEKLRIMDMLESDSSFYQLLSETDWSEKMRQINV